MPIDSVPTLNLSEVYSFTDLKVRRVDDEAIDRDMDVVKLVCNIKGSNLDKALQNTGQAITSFITVWHKSHLPQRGASDAVMAELKSQGPRLN